MGELDDERPGFFRAFTQAVHRSLTTDQWQHFASLTSDSERVQLLYHLPEVRKVALSALHQNKDEAEAKQRKDEGNKAFAAGDYAKAMRCYSQAIVAAPFKGERVAAV